MRCYMAPLEGLTVHTYRNAFHKVFGGIDKYFTPFIAAEGSRKMKSREVRDVLPENNEGLNVVPQIISNRANNFIRFARLLQDRGYNEINLNLGCPSGTVVSKGKGSGFLAYPEELNHFLEDVFSQLTDIQISIKTRIGVTDPDEIYALMDIFNQYPIYELIVHPRIRTDFYKNKPRLEQFQFVYNSSKNPVCYNGDIRTCINATDILNEYPKVNMIMLGRGLIRNPMLAVGIQQGSERLPTKDQLRHFHDLIYFDYKNTMPNDIVVLYKMKEIWGFMVDIFSEHEPYSKMIKKASSLVEYDVFVNRLFRECQLG